MLVADGVVATGRRGGERDGRCLCPTLSQVAVRALQQLLSMGAAGGAQGLAAVCERLPDPSEEAIEEAGLPPFEGGPGLLCQIVPDCARLADSTCFPPAAGLHGRT